MTGALASSITGDIMIYGGPYIPESRLELVIVHWAGFCMNLVAHQTTLDGGGSRPSG